MRLNSRPDSLAQKQALAAVGQVHLMRYYDDLFTAVDMVRDALCCASCVELVLRSLPAGPGSTATCPTAACCRPLHLGLGLLS